jgi:hypothetical protein
MSLSEEKFQIIAEKFMLNDKHVELGKMMSFPGIKYKNKVFAFYYQEKMVFRLGKNFDLVAEGIKNFSLLNPFKTKPPRAGWFQIPIEYSIKWEELARKALAGMKQKID